MNCPKNAAISEGDLACEECDHWKSLRSGKFNKHGIEIATEFCGLIEEIIASVGSDSTEES